MRKEKRFDPAPEAITIAALDGHSLGASLFGAQRGRGRRGTVIIHGATAVPQGYYRAFATFLAARGLRVVTYDYRGVGRSRPASLRGFRASMTDWARLDAAAIHRFVDAHHDDEPVAIVGHSFGGQLLGLLDATHRAQGAYLVAAQLPTVDMWPMPRRLLVELFFRGIVPSAAAATGYVPGWAGLGEDLPAGVAKEWADWCRSPSYITSAHPDAGARFAAYRGPVCLTSFSDDSFAPPRSIAAFLGAISGADVEHRHVTPDCVGAPIGHFGYFRPRFEHRFWPAAAGWLEAVLDGRPPPRSVLITEEELARDLGYRA